MSQSLLERAGLEKSNRYDDEDDEDSNIKWQAKRR